MRTYYVGSSGNSLPTFRDNLSAPPSLKTVPIGWPETSVRNCHYSLRNRPEERSSHLLCGGSLKSLLRTPCFLPGFDTTHIWSVTHFFPLHLPSGTLKVAGTRLSRCARLSKFMVTEPKILRTFTPIITSDLKNGTYSPVHIPAEEYCLCPISKWV